MTHKEICVLAYTIVIALLAGCGGGGSSNTNSTDSSGNSGTTTSTYTVGGAVSGLVGSGLVLQLNGGNDLTVSADGAITFPAIADGSSYAVTVTTQPTSPNQTCAVTNGSGTLAGANVSDVQVTCTTNNYAISGGVYGLKGTGLVLQLNGGNDLTVNGSGAFAFPAQADGSTYTVTVKTQPTGTPAQTCSATNGSGTVSSADVTALSVNCSPWTKQFGGGGDTEASATATDAEGNVYVAGYTNKALDGNAQVGAVDAFLIKYDPYGKRLYTRQWGAAGVGTGAFGVAVDGSGNVFVTGYTSGGLDGNTLTGTSDFFVTKFDLAGNHHTWQLGAVGVGTHASGVAVDGSGNVYVTGYTYGGLDGNTLIGVIDFFVTKFDSAGNHHTWQLGAAGTTTAGNGVAVDGSGNVYVAGHTRGNLDGNTLTGTMDIFLTRYDAVGNHHTWQLGAAGTDASATGIAVDGNGNVYVAGYTAGGLDGNAMTGTQDAFLTKYDTVGNRHTWQWGATGSQTYGYGIAIDSSGNVYVAGTTMGNLDGNTSSGGWDFFLTRYDAAGNRQSRQLGAGGETGAFAVAVDGGGNVYVAGYTLDNLDGNTLSAANAFDAFLAKYDAVGNKQ